MRYPLPWFRFLVCPNRYNRRTKPVCLRYRSSLSGCRFDRIGSSGFVGGFHRLRWFNRGFVLKVHSCRNRCRYRYICRPVGLPAADDCRPKRSGFLLRGRLKLLRFSDGLCLSFCPRHRRCRPKSLCCRLF